jgi:hypothetical protein
MMAKCGNPLLVMFSDEPGWCRKNLKWPVETLVLEPNYLSAEDMYLMSLCKHNVIANSSFSWWGAWLNANPLKVVIAPKPWLSGATEQPDIIPQGWVELAK